MDAAGIEYRETELLPGCLELAGGSIDALPGYGEGLFYVQDRAARMAVDIAAPESASRVMDACAAPGGKSFAAAIAMRNTGCILARDIHEKKLALIRSGAQRLGIDIIETQARDAREPDAASEAGFDLVIADVPCSGFGVMGKKPEIRLKKEDEIAKLPEIQRQILDNVSAFVKPGGTLLYSTCTILRAENEEIAEGFLAAHSEFEPLDFKTCDIASARGMYTFWPNTDGTDGFFAAKMRRKT